MRYEELLENGTSSLSKSYVAALKEHNFQPLSFGFGKGSKPNSGTTSQVFVGSSSVIKVSFDLCWKSYIEYVLTQNEKAHLPKIIQNQNHSNITSKISSEGKIRSLKFNNRKISYNNQYIIYAVEMEKLQDLDYSSQINNGNDLYQAITNLSNIITNHENGNEDTLSKHALRLKKAYNGWKNDQEIKNFLKQGVDIYRKFHNKNTCFFDYHNHSDFKGGGANIMVRGQTLVFSDPIRGNKRRSASS